jgi:hypothetical protein
MLKVLKGALTLTALSGTAYMFNRYVQEKQPSGNNLGVEDKVGSIGKTLKFPSIGSDVYPGSIPEPFMNKDKTILFETTAIQSMSSHHIEIETVEELLRPKLSDLEPHKTYSTTENNIFVLYKRDDTITRVVSVWDRS